MSFLDSKFYWTFIKYKNLTFPRPIIIYTIGCEFDEWLTDAVTRGDEHLLTNYRQLAPYPERAYPYPDHYMPLLSAFAAAGKGAKGNVIHHSWYTGDLGMASYSFRTV